jgi:IS5 family transposase
MALRKSSKARGRDMPADMAIGEIRKEIEHYCSLGSRVIDQTRRRVLQGEQVLNAKKIYSIFEPHTDLIKRGKVRTTIEFGHKVFLAESAQGLITQYEVLKGNPPDEVHVAPSLQRHKRAFGRTPELYGSDRGFFSDQNVTSCTRNGVKVVCSFRAGWRAASRSCSEVAALKRCLAEGAERFELWVAAAVLATTSRTLQRC